VRARLTVLSLLAGMTVPASSALAAPPQELTASSGGIGIRLVGVPSDSGNGPLADSYIVGRPAPGTSIRRRIEVSNSTGSAADVSVYPAAAGLRRGNFTFAPGHSRNELSTWTSLSRDVVLLSPGSRAFETLTINVPKQASSGERYAVVWAEVSAPAPVTGGVTLVNRVGVRIYLSIGPGGAPRSNFAIGSLAGKRLASGEPVVVATIHNSGKRTLDIRGNLTLSKGPGGLRAGPFPVDLGALLAPGDSTSATVRLDRRLPRGPWRAQMRLTDGLIHRVAEATIRFPRHAGAAQPRVDSGGSRLPAVVGLVLLVLLAGAASVLVRSRRRASRSRIA
jgi:hypothetical protein